ncbi:Predicted metal-dependent hydrolase [Mycobacteroides abscessus subsp. abscessus]|nr:Predicted metal-dependent hydrolase [Mycobacteroides abscessus subsp. abscessus]
MAAPATAPYPKTRRIRFWFGDPVPMRRHFADNDIALSHVLAGASAVFPPGEEFFVRSVRRYADRITEPTLKKRVAGFIGQEVTHGLHHRELNEKLTEMGYRSKMVENIGRRSGKVEDLVDKYLPNMDRLKYVRLTMLAATAALEHYTAVLAERLLESSELQDMVTDDEVRNLLYWHAIEELEHKSGASAVFPPGEEFFVRSVRRYADRITEPTLKKRVAGFIGQEVTHGLHHRELNEKLTEMGYRSKMVENIGRRSGKVEDLVDKYLPNMDRLKYVRLTMLAATAALEHYTAVLAERLLESSELQDMVTDDEVRNLLYWHAIEELEHKSVAFDVYRAVGGPEWLRRAVMAVIWTGTVPFATAGSWFSIAWSDPDGRRQPGRVLRETVGLIRGPLLNDGMIGRLAVYMKKDFHPDDLDTDALLDQWRAELFGADGTLVDHLK